MRRVIQMTDETIHAGLYGIDGDLSYPDQNKGLGTFTCAPSNIDNLDFYIRGFSMKDTIIEALKIPQEEPGLTDETVESIAEDVKHIFGRKLRLFQG